MVVATRGNVVAPAALEPEALGAVDALTVECYRPIFESYLSMLGEECYEAVRLEPELTWEERKTQQNRRLFDEHPDWLWVLDEDGDVFGFVSFWLFPEQSYGHIDNNGVHADRAGQGWATFMYRTSSTTSASRGCASRTWTPGSTTRISRRAGRTRRRVSTGPFQESSTGRTCLSATRGLRSARCPY